MDEMDKSDFFIQHFQNLATLDQNDTVFPPNSAHFNEQTYEWQKLGQFMAKFPKHQTEVYEPKLSAENFKLSKTIQDYIQNDIEFDQFQLELLTPLHEYRDLYFTKRSHLNADKIRRTYCIHIVDHLLKSRLLITSNDAAITNKFEVPDNLRDQGLTRAKVLVILPFKNSVLQVIQTMSKVLFNGRSENIMHKKRFYDEFTGGEISLSQKSSRPEDYSETFSGNIDDNFKIGITLTKKSLKLYTDFHHSDIIIASPLGLRLAIGNDGEAEYDCDFLSSIEILIMDQTEIFLMQNWDHLLHIIDHVNLQPRKPHDTDFSRVRCWTLNGFSKYYRQNFIISSYPLLQITALVVKRCLNYDGFIQTNNYENIGKINEIIATLSVPHIFHRLSDASAIRSAEERFTLFTQKLLPQFQDNLKTNVLVYIPSYFDFLKLKNYFISEAISFVCISEYTKDKKVSEARDKFFHGEVNYMLYSERFHFYMRRKIRGIRHIVFYQLPTFPHFYSEICNAMEITNPKINRSNSHSDDISASVASIYSKFDAPQLASVVSTDRAVQMLASKKDVHMIMVQEAS